MTFKYDITYIKRLGKWFQPYNFSINGKRFTTDANSTIHFLPSTMADSQVQSVDEYIRKFYGKNITEIRFRCSSAPSPEDEDKFILIGPFEDAEIGNGMSYRSERDSSIIGRICWDGINKIAPDLSELPDEFYIKKIFDKKAKKNYTTNQHEAKIASMSELYKLGIITKEEMEEFK